MTFSAKGFIYHQGKLLLDHLFLTYLKWKNTFKNNEPFEFAVHVIVISDLMPNRL